MTGFQLYSIGINKDNKEVKYFCKKIFLSEKKAKEYAETFRDICLSNLANFDFQIMEKITSIQVVPVEIVED
jgi:hypothetical protein